jgi:hypothetical protein
MVLGMDAPRVQEDGTYMDGLVSYRWLILEMDVYLIQVAGTRVDTPRLQVDGKRD